VAAQTIILEHKDARFEVFQNDDGSKSCLSLRQIPVIIRIRCPADDATLALLANTSLLIGPIFRAVISGIATPAMDIMAVHCPPANRAIVLLRRAWKKDSGFPNPAQSGL